MTPIVTAGDLFETQQQSLKLKWLAGRSGAKKPLEPANAKYPGMALVGHMNFVHPNRVQVLGSTEITYLNKLAPAELKKAIHNFATCKRTVAVVVANNKKISTKLIKEADKFKLPLFASPFPSPIVIEQIQYYLARVLAPRVTLHGVYMEVMGMGVLITGESGIGKSELALELLSRNHRLIADDAVEFTRITPNILLGQCPEALSDYLEVRGLGIINVRAMFGETAIRHKKKLHLIVNLQQLKRKDLGKIDRLHSDQVSRSILDVEMPEVSLFVAPGRNLAILVEAATRAHILRVWGFNPLDEFMKRQQTMIDNSHK